MDEVLYVPMLSGSWCKDWWLMEVCDSVKAGPCEGEGKRGVADEAPVAQGKSRKSDYWPQLSRMVRKEDYFRMRV